MKIQYLIPLGLFLACLMAACKKEKPQPYSYWTINGQEYSSNNVEKAIGKDIALLGSRDNDRFDISFRFGRFPTSGTWPIIKTQTNDPSFAGVYFYLGISDLSNGIYILKIHSKTNTPEYIKFNKQ